MRKNLATVLTALFLVCVTLSAQPQALPSVEIGSDVAVKAPLVKKPLPYPGETPADSIPPMIPPVFSLKHRPSALPQGTLRPLRLELSSGTDFETKLAVSCYPSLRFIPLLRLDADLWVPGTNVSRSTLNASLQTDFDPELRFNHLFSWQKAKTRCFATGAFSYSIANLYSEIAIHDIYFSNLKTDLSLEEVEQNLAGASQADFAIGIRHSHDLELHKLKFTNRLVLQDTAFGLSVQYHAPWLEEHLPELKLGLMTDFIHVLPVIDLHRRFLLGRGKYLELSNRSEFQNLTFQRLRELYPWTVLPERERVVMTPLNLSLSGWQAFNDEDALFRLLGFRQNLRFSYNQPQLYVRDVSGQTWLRQTDILSYRLGAEASMQFWGWIIDQDLNLNLEYLQDERWRRRPFSPIFNALTEARHNLGELELLAQLDQQYWRRDEFDQPLSAVFDLSLGLSLPLRSGLSLTAGLNNVFNSKHGNFGDLPNPGRSLRVSFSYLPLR